MSDILQLQDFLFLGLKSCALFDRFNITQEREFRMQSELEFNAIWQMPRLDANGAPIANPKVGAGLYVEMPKLEVPKPNSLQRNLLVSVAVIEERNLNMTPGTGSLMDAEQIAELALDFMFGWVLPFASGLTPEKGAVTPAPDLIDVDGLVAYRASVSLRREHRPVNRCDQPEITDAGNGSFTIANGANTPDAEIYYTLDNSFPGKANPDAQRYNAAIAPGAGRILTCAAWRFDRLPSHLKQTTT